MGFFNNMKNLKDQALENEKIKNYEQLQVYLMQLIIRLKKKKKKIKRKENILKV